MIDWRSDPIARSDASDTVQHKIALLRFLETETRGF